MRNSQTPVSALGMVVVSMIPMFALGILLAIPGDDYGRGKLLVALVTVVWCGIPSAGFWINRAIGGSDIETNLIAKPQAAPTHTASAISTFLNVGLDRLNRSVKDIILDFRFGPEPNEFTAPNSEDIPLQPLDRNAFAERMRPLVDDAIEAAAEILSKPATDRELAGCGEQLGRVADSFRWNALEVAMELRTAAGAGESDTKNTHPELPPKTWAQKFRLMRASGF